MKQIVVVIVTFALAGSTLGQNAQPTLLSEPGMYVEAASGLTNIIGQIAEFKRTGSTLVSRATVGIKTVKENIQLLGPHVQTAVSPRPTFYFIPAKQEADAGVNAVAKLNEFLEAREQKPYKPDRPGS